MAVVPEASFDSPAPASRPQGILVRVAQLICAFEFITLSVAALSVLLSTPERELAMPRRALLLVELVVGGVFVYYASKARRWVFLVTGILNSVGLAGFLLLSIREQKLVSSLGLFACWGSTVFLPLLAFRQMRRRALANRTSPAVARPK